MTIIKAYYIAWVSCTFVMKTGLKNSIVLPLIILILFSFHSPLEADYIFDVMNKVLFLGIFNSIYSIFLILSN